MPKYEVKTSQGTFVVEADREPTEADVLAALRSQKAAAVPVKPAWNVNRFSVGASMAPTPPPIPPEGAAAVANGLANMGIRGAPPAIGQAIGAATGPFAPAMIPFLGALGGMGGEAAAQFREGRGMRGGAIFGAGVAGAIPAAPFARGGISLVKEAGKQVAGNLAAKATETAVDEGRLPSVGEAGFATAGGVAGTALGKALDAGTKAAATTEKEIANAVRDQTLAAAQAAGYVIPPSRVNPSTVNKVLESLAGKAATAQEAVVRNQEVTNALARKAIGAPANAPLTESLLRNIRQEAAKPYDEIRTFAKQAEADLDVLKKSRLTASNAHELAVQASEPSTVREMASLAKKAAADVDELKAAKFDANAYFTQFKKNGDPEAYKKAITAKARADDLEEKIIGAAEELGKPELAQALKDARVRIAKVHQVEKALNLGDANVSAPILGRSLDAGKPLTNELKTIAQTQQAFPQSMRDASGVPTAGVNQLLPMGAGMAAAQGQPQGMAAALMMAATGPARSAILSRPYQSMMARPNYPVPQPDFLANAARLSAQAESRQPNPFLQFLRDEFPSQQPRGNQFLRR